MAGKKFGGSGFLLLGAAYWLVMAALLAAAHYFWPDLTFSQPFIVGTIFAAVIAGFLIVYFFRPR
jgi:hypothetical protein